MKCIKIWRVITTYTCCPSFGFMAGTAVRWGKGTTETDVLNAGAAVERSGDTEWLTGLLMGEEEGSNRKEERNSNNNSNNKRRRENSNM